MIHIFLTSIKNFSLIKQLIPHEAIRRELLRMEYALSKMNVSIYTFNHVYVFINEHTCVYIYIHVYIHI
jgi:hypothetical protein